MSSINLSQRLGIEFGVKEFLLKVAHEQIGIGGAIRVPMAVPLT